MLSFSCVQLRIPEFVIDSRQCFKSQMKTLWSWTHYMLCNWNEAKVKSLSEFRISQEKLDSFHDQEKTIFFHLNLKFFKRFNGIKNGPKCHKIQFRSICEKLAWINSDGYTLCKVHTRLSLVLVRKQWLFINQIVNKNIIPCGNMMNHC